MFEMGISVYSGFTEYTKELNDSYMEKAGRLGYKLVFTSGHISEASKNQDEFNSLLASAKKANLKLMIDVSKPMMSLFKLDPAISTLRLDYGFSDEDIVNLSNSKDFSIQLNASTVSIDKLKKLISLGLNQYNTSLCYNFYPKPYTGHDLSFVKERTSLFKNLGFKVIAFIPSFNGRRAPLYEGLPTVEAHRKQDLNLSIEELKACSIDGIIFGDSYASIAELELLKLHQTDDILIPTKLYSPIAEELFDISYRIRPDYNDTLLRVARPRVSDIVPFNTNVRLKYDLTMDNRLFGRYSGEVNIINKPLPEDDRCNVIGHVDLSEILIDEIKKGKSFRFISKEQLC